MIEPGAHARKAHGRLLRAGAARADEAGIGQEMAAEIGRGVKQKRVVFGEVPLHVVARLIHPIAVVEDRLVDAVTQIGRDRVAIGTTAPEQRNQDEIGAVVAILDRRQCSSNHGVGFGAAAARRQPRQRPHGIGLGEVGDLVPGLRRSCRQGWQGRGPDAPHGRFRRRRPAGAAKPDDESDTAKCRKSAGRSSVAAIAMRLAPASMRRRKITGASIDMKSPSITIDYVHRDRQRDIRHQRHFAAGIGWTLEMHRVESGFHGRRDVAFDGRRQGLFGSRARRDSRVGRSSVRHARRDRRTRC